MTNDLQQGDVSKWSRLSAGQLQVKSPNTRLTFTVQSPRLKQRVVRDGKGKWIMELMECSERGTLYGNWSSALDLSFNTFGTSNQQGFSETDKPPVSANGDGRAWMLTR
ncbi:hypothetical protein WMY93_003347 [Mugilogobius chulae]|uniref:Uncharacterized protein n=1 Tax=Mugilogobius chulae TaxID=88201 RepID=A0AAW0Q232_9GOBI